MNRNHVVGLVIVAAIMISALALTPTGSAATQRVLEITTASSGATVPFGAFDGNPPKVFDINGDGKKEIIAQNDNQWIYIFDSSTGKVLAELKTTIPIGWGARSFNGPEVSVMTEDGRIKLVAASSSAHIISWRFDPIGSTNIKFAFVKEWEKRLNECGVSQPGMDSKPVLADLDKDGRFEILANTEEVGLYALRHDGQKFWTQCVSGGNSEPTIADLNLDGNVDVVQTSDNGRVRAFHGKTGIAMWPEFNVFTKFDLGSGSIPVGAAVGHLDDVGGPDIVFGARDSHDSTNWANDHAAIVAIDQGGKFLWGKQDAQAAPLTYTHPIIADADGNGKNEVYWADWNTVGHKPPDPNGPDAWKRTGPGHFYRFDNLGNLVWRQTLDTFWQNKDIPIADVDGDGVQEMLANGPHDNGRDGIWYLDVRTGAKEAFVDLWPYQLKRAPVVADLYGTGGMQWVAEVAPYGPGSVHAILVYDTGVTYNAIWPHLPYPALGPPPPPMGCFEGRFDIKAPNAWWQELYVYPDTPSTITAAEVQLNDGAWLDMTKSSWGAWTSSYNAPSGTKVEFRAIDASNKAGTSQAFTWLDGTLTKRSVACDGTSPSPTPTTTTPTPTTTSASPTPTTSTPSPTPTTTSTSPTTTVPPIFDANFAVSPNVNEWWVEVAVTANQPIAGVDLKIRTGDWQALTLRDWGNWAKGVNVPKGTPVQFRATSTTGLTDTSETTYWMSTGPQPFNPTFDPRAVGNDWWVEVALTTSHVVTKVEAKVNSGAFTPLDPTSWSTWAKSIHAPNGSIVQFRATSENGETALSQTYTWP